MNKIRMYSKADLAQGHGVLSAHDDQVALIKNRLFTDFKVVEKGHARCAINHFHTINPEFLFFALLGRIRGSKNVGSVHFLPETLKNSIRLPRPAEWLYYRYILFFYRRMDALVTVNPYFIDVLEQKYHIPRSKVTYIPNVVSSAKFYPMTANEKRGARARFCLPEKDFVVLCAGQLQKRKGIYDFIEIAEKMPDIRFVWAGGFSFGRISQDYEAIRKIVAAPPPNVTFLGLVSRDDMNLLYNACDIMLLASYEELFPMAILEAMRCERPILVRSLELYEDILFDYVQYADSVKDFVARIRQLQKDPAFYRHCSNCSKLGAAEYSEESVSSAWRSFYSFFC